MINTVIIDDEKDARDTLRNFLTEYCQDISIVGEADSVENGVNSILKHQPNLVFLDINMADGSGFDLLDKLPIHNFKLVFTTAYDQYALKAFKYSAIDYLMKPINPVDLKAAVDKINTSSVTDNLEQKLYVLVDSFQQKNFERISLPTLDGLEIIKIEHIVRCQADSNYTHFYLDNSKKITVTKTLKEYEELFPEDQFCRIHQSHIINLNQVTKYVRGDGGVVTMSDGTEIDVSRRRKQFLLDKLA